MNAKAPAFSEASLFSLLLASLAVVTVLGVHPRPAWAAESPALVKEVSALDDAATAAYSAGDFDKMKKHLLKALAAGKEALATHAIMARVYLHLGVLYVDGLENRPVGVKYFAKALKIRPDIEVRPNMATKTVMAAFTEAEQQQEATAAEEPPARETAKSSRKEPAAEKDDDKGREAEPERHPARAAASEKGHGDSEIADVKKQGREEIDRPEKALTMAKETLSKERIESDKLRHDKMDLERQLGEAKQRVAQLESEVNQKDQRATAGEQREKRERDARDALAKEKTEKDSLLMTTAQKIQQLERDNNDKDKQLAAAALREKKERDNNEKLEREKGDRDRMIADLKVKAQQSESDLKARLQQIERDKSDKEKQLAATTDRERKEREARERLEKDRQTTDARDRERKAWEDRARAERDKVEAVPPLPSRIPEPVHCAIPDEVQSGADFFVNCVAQPGVKAKTIVFYYRPASATVYNSLVMDPTKKGWSRAVITANKLNGKLLQYYVEARDGRDAVAANNGKASSPNIVPIAAPGKR